MKYSDIELVVLTAGKATRLYPLTLGFPKCLLSVNQKPAIFNMITPMIERGLTNITFVVNIENKFLIEMFMNNVFSQKKLNIKYVIQKECDGPAGALKLIKNNINKPLMILLGDTICEIPDNLDKSWIGVSRISKEKERYCMVECDNDKKITVFLDKCKDIVKTDYAAIGIYYLQNYKLISNVLKKKMPKIENEYQLSSVFEEYLLKENIYIEEFQHWNDIGTLSSYKKTNLNKFNCRYFNNLSLDNHGIIVKSSTYKKIETEIEWFRKNQNTSFGKMSPKFYDYGTDSMQYGIEYYDYLTLMEYICYYPLENYNIKIIFKELFDKLTDCYNESKKDIPKFNENTKKVLIDKTNLRIKRWERKDLLNKEYIYINKKKYLGFNTCLKLLSSEIDKIIANSNKYISIIHGDVAFSNILYSPRTQIFKIIDPRGDFGISTIYGDNRYDIAKLRHCYHGRYDEIINDLFDLNINNEIEYKFYKNINYSIYDEIVKEKYDINDIELIEGLLFISMIPLHSDYPKRQIMFFAKGIECLNNQLERRK